MAAHRMIKRAMWPLAGVLALSAGHAQQPSTPAASPCSTAEHRQFDFWLGEWQVTNPAGKTAGHSRIEAILGGCVLQETWRGTTPTSHGKSFNLHNAQAGQWEQYWVDAGGNRLHLSGGRVGAAMVLQGEQDKPAASGQVQRERITWTPNADGSVRQLWETSRDDGKSWAVSFDGLYRRVGPTGTPPQE